MKYRYVTLEVEGNRPGRKQTQETCREVEDKDMDDSHIKLSDAMDHSVVNGG